MARCLEPLLELSVVTAKPFRAATQPCRKHPPAQNLAQTDRIR